MAYIVMGSRLWAMLGLIVHRDQAHLIPSPTRARVLSIIRERPGIALADIAQRAGLTWGTAKYHATRLEHAGLVGTRAIGRRRVCYALVTGGESIAVARGLLSEPTPRRLAQIIAENPGVSIVGLMELSGNSQRVVYYHVKRFLEGGLVARANGRSYRGLDPTELLFAALA